MAKVYEDKEIMQARKMPKTVVCQCIDLMPKDDQLS